MKVLALFGRKINQESIAYFQELLNILEVGECALFFHRSLLEKNKDNIDFPKDVKAFEKIADIPQPVDMLISIGGDGTFLDSINIIGNSGIPVVGINLGNLGFLASISKEEMQTAIQALQAGEYEIDKRNLLHIESKSGHFDFGKRPYALNDVSIFKADPNLMMPVDIYVDGYFLNRYHGDGLIIATSTGSTAYSLSAGGPILLPDSENLIITPIASHTLTVRPLIVPDKCEITVHAGFDKKGFNLSLDSNPFSFKEETTFSIRKENFQFNTVRLKNQHFFDTLRKKLMWGARFN